MRRRRVDGPLAFFGSTLMIRIPTVHFYQRRKSPSKQNDTRKNRKSMHLALTFAR
jgi:hypothetical protein